MDEIKIGQIPIILLVGGKSSRMKRPKGLLDYNGRPWLLKQIELINNSGLSLVTIVLGHYHENYLRSISLLNDTQNNEIEYDNLKITTVINLSPEDGQFSSIYTGLKHAIKHNSSGVLILPIDVPCGNRSVFDEIIKAIVESSQDKIDAVKIDYLGEGGHPVFLSNELCQNIIELDEDQIKDARLDKILKEKNVKRVSVDDEKIILNINLQNDWIKFLNMKEQ